MPNNGTSIHDVLARTEQSVVEIRTEQGGGGDEDACPDGAGSESQRHDRDDPEDG